VKVVSLSELLYPSKSPVPRTARLPPHRAGLASGKQIMTKPTEEQIRQRAQEIWEENHRPTGRDDEFWYQAEKDLNEGVTGDEKSETFLE
jgi:Protein of unknown function (DUF2934)